MSQHLFLWTGAIIVPSEFKSMYSTYILLLCLYLMHQRQKLDQDIALLLLIIMYLANSYIYHKFNELFSSIAFIYDNFVMVEKKLLWLKSYVDNLFWPFESWRFSRALIFGLKNGMDQSDKWVVQVVGVGHLFVVSGLHVGFVYAMLRVSVSGCWYFFPNLWVDYLASKKWIEVSLGSLLILSYGFLVGWEPAITRACIMLLVWRYLHLFHYSISIHKLLWLAFISLLIVDANVFYETGFWLSFVLVYLIVHMGRVPLPLPYRLAGIQTILSIGALIMIAGWQDYVSIYTILVNFFMVPFTAIFWFPISFISIVETIVFNTYFLMTVVDCVVMFVFRMLQVIAFDFYIMPLNMTLSMFFKVFAVSVLAFSVMFFKGKSFVVAAFMAFTFLFVEQQKNSSISIICTWFNQKCSSQITILKNTGSNILLTQDSFEKSEELRFNTNWFSGGEELGDYLFRIKAFDKSIELLLWPDAQAKLTSQVVFALLPDIVVFHSEPNRILKMRLIALGVNWLVIERNQSLIIEKYRDYIDIRFSGCHYLYLSEDRSHCERVEIFQNMIN